MLEIASALPPPKARTPQFATFSTEAAREELEQLRAEMDANAERLARVPQSRRAAMRERAIARVPRELVADVYEEFELAAAFAMRARSAQTPRVRSSHRERRAHASVAPSAILGEGEAEPPQAVHLAPVSEVQHLDPADLAFLDTIAEWVVRSACASSRKEGAS